jgi:RND superfamily putative drug exporter
MTSLPLFALTHKKLVIAFCLLVTIAGIASAGKAFRSFSDHYSVKMIATGLGAGILLDATIIRALLVPAAVALFGRWNWLLPTPLARVLRAPAAAVRELEGGRR